MTPKRNTPLLLFAVAIACIGLVLLKGQSLIKQSPKVVNNTESPVNDQPDIDSISPPLAQPHIQVVFALDATGSMSGLISAAKEKIWSIASSLSQTNPAPVIEMGLVFYRDKQDDFVTKKLPLNSNLDEVYAALMQIEAGGGGDEPESVNQGLYEAVTAFQWNKDTTTYKTVFLVGDCPPHMDYRDDVKYPASCKLAKEKDIVLNTILMGDNSSAKKIWQEIANCSQGSFTTVGMDANDLVVKTPYDEQISHISDVLDSTRYYYGSVSYKVAASEKKNKSYEVATSDNYAAKAQRAEYNDSKAGKQVYMGSNELLSDVKNKKLLLDTLRDALVPDEIKHLSKADRKFFVESKIQLRDSLQKQLQILITKRSQYIEGELAKKDSAAVDKAFNSIIYKEVKKQTERKKIKLEGKAKY